VVVAAEPLLRLGLTCAVELIQARSSNGQPGGAPALEFRGAADSARAAHKLLATLRAPLALLVLDPPLRDVTFAGACAMLIQAHPAAAALVLLGSPDRVSVRLACRHGARAVHDTAITVEQLESVLGTLLDGGVSIQPSLVQYLLDGGPDGGPDGGGGEGDELGKAGPRPLTERELVALQFLARGYASKEIAALVGATPKAVDLTIERAARRLGASHRAQAVAIAIKRRLIT
jgi:DNA-binding NarL/FixJ family response regulator